MPKKRVFVIKIEKISGSDIFQDRLDDKIIEFDKINMAEILGNARLPFPEEKRRKGFEDNSTFVVAWKENKIVAYLEYCRSWDNDKDIFISSLQILPEYRGSTVLLLILDYARDLLFSEKFDKIVSGVQKNNVHAVRLYKKLGFSIYDNPGNKQSLIVSAKKDILSCEVVSKLLNKWHKI
jgi:ribosomal protein S18 acetylase RimI-like enzyme